MSVRSALGILVVSLTFLSVAACRHTPEVVEPPAIIEPGDGGTSDHALGDCHPTPGAPGNPLHVGQYCTHHGGECGKNPKGNANSCAIDFDRRAGGYCIKIFCSSSAECGPGACCYGEPGGLAKACIPMGCVADAGVCPK